MNASLLCSTEAHESILIRVRSDFSSWAAHKGMFETLCIFAQVRLVVSTRIKALACISNDVSVHLSIHADLLKRYDNDREAMFFIIMHELRHLTQATSFRDWVHLVSLYPLLKALHDVCPKATLDKAGVTSLEADHELKYDIINLAADAAIHEDLTLIFGLQMLERVSVLMTEISMATQEKLTGDTSDGSASKVGLVTVDVLEQMTQRPLERQRDWLYYVQRLIESLSERVRSAPELAGLLLERQILRRIRMGGLDEHEIDVDSLSQIDHMLGRARGESKKMLAAYQASFHGSVAGFEALEDEEIYAVRKELSKTIREVIAQIRATVTKGERPKSHEKKSYAYPHRFLQEAPGVGRHYRSSGRAEAVLVLDTSGSMWFPEILGQMATMAYQLLKRGLIKKAFCCDAVLHPLDRVTGGSVRFKGAGGTVWSKDHHSEILKTMNTSAKVTIYYCTDEGVNGLQEAKQDERVNLVVINLPKMISLHERSRL